MKLLLDTNVILDVLLDRDPHASVSSGLWAAVEEGRASGFVAAHALTTIHYLVRKDRDARVARRVTTAILDVFHVAPVDGSVLSAALDLGWSDYEDAVTTAAAISAGCDLIATRNPRDFKESPVPVLDPASALAALLTPS
ncbi:MAG: PIN domain-containing protein [Thermoanaerobaculia bacterium]